jgi:hypothetical protein
MGKDNFDFQHIVTNLTADKLNAEQERTQQQMLTALCLMVVGLILAFTGTIGLVLKLGQLASIGILFSVRPATILLLRKRNQKTTVI